MARVVLRVSRDFSLSSEYICRRVRFSTVNYAIALYSKKCRVNGAPQTDFYSKLFLSLSFLFLGALLSQYASHDLQNIDSRYLFT